MQAKLDVCYHVNKEAKRKKQVSKQINSLFSNQVDKSFHLDFNYNNRSFTLDLYNDCFGLIETTNADSPETLAYINFEKQ